MDDPNDTQRRARPAPALAGADEMEDTLQRPPEALPSTDEVEDTFQRPPQAGVAGEEDTFRRSPLDAGVPDTGRPEALGRGTQVGRYVILKPVGHGGMGMVYAAYDPELDRKVALKLLRPDHGSGSAMEARTRLLREAQAMARVSHPNVCSVFDVGTFGDQVFVAMEFIEGPTLQQWLQEPRSWREVLRMLCEAGQGLVAAHEAGLVHRDFKPANVLVGKGGRPYVTDFGLARPAAGESRALARRVSGQFPIVRSVVAMEVTQVGAAVGTPLYMPPEQHLGLGPDARSDQFSFCVVLFNALFGQRPFEPQEMARAVAVMASKAPDARGISPAIENVLRPPPRDSKVPVWVRRAVLRGLSLNPADRFPTFKELLDELSQEPQRARRRRTAVAAGVVLASLAASVWGVRRQSQVCTGANRLMEEVWNPVVQRSIAAAFAATGKPFAGDVARTVTRSLEAYARAWESQHTEACLDTRVRGVQTEELLSKRVVCLERRRKDLRALAQVLAGADAQVVEKAVNAAGALPALQECQDLDALTNQTSLPADPARRAEIDGLGTRLAQVKAQTDTGKYQSALDLASQLEPQVVAAGYRPLLAEARYRLGWLRFLNGESAEDEKTLEQAFNDAEAGRADRFKLWTVTRLAFINASRRHWEQADRWAGIARATLDRIGNDELLTSELMANLGLLELIRERYPEARVYLEKSRELQERVLPAGHPSRIQVLRSLANTMTYLGEEARAVELSSAVLQQAMLAWGSAHPEVAGCHLVLGQALHEVGEDTRALEHARAAADIWRASFGPGHHLVAGALNDVGRYQLALGAYPEALETFKRGLASQQEALDSQDPRLQSFYDGIGQALLGQGKAAEAVVFLEKALSFTNAQVESLAESNFGLARALWALGRHERALAEANRARERFLQVGVARRANEVSAWLKALPPRAGTRGEAAP